jgi:glycosyltransferase involved in cell wall biosynthesis
MEHPTISLVIPAYNEEKYIGECLNHVKNSQGNFLEIIVVDNASTDKTAEIAKSYAGVRVVREENKGLTYARQRGYLEAKGDILAFVDADTWMPIGWYSKVVKEFSEHKDTACLSGPYIYHDISKINQFLVKVLYWYMLAMPIYWIIGYMVTGGNFAIRKDILEKMKGFDTTIEFYGEDTNIARRAHKFGKVKFKPSFVMYISGRRLNSQGIFKTAFLYITNYLGEVILHKPINREYKDFR